MAVLQWFRKNWSRARAVTALGVVSLVVSLAACDQSKEADKAKQAGAAATASGRSRRRGHPEDGADLQRVRRADRGQGNGGDPRPGAGVPRGTALHRGHDRQEGPAAVHARPARIRGEAAAGQGAARGCQCETRQGRNRRAAPEASGRAPGRAPAGLRQRRRESGDRPRGSLGRQGRSRRGGARPELLHDPLTDQRPYRQAAGRSREIWSARARPRCSTRCRVSIPFASSSPSARRNISGFGASRSGANGVRRTARVGSGRRQRLPAQGQARHHRSGRRRQDRHSHRRSPSSRTRMRCCARGSSAACALPSRLPRTRS